MRTVTLSGQDFIVTPLKGKDLKALKAQGYDLMRGGYSISDGMSAVFTSRIFWPCTRPSWAKPSAWRKRKKTSLGLGVAFR